jgi:amidophosphoribosyltransferase
MAEVLIGDEFDKPREDCGVFGVYAPRKNATGLTYRGLQLLQHRGQEGAGISASDGEKIGVYTDTGLVKEVFGPFGRNADATVAGEPLLSTGHVRYSTIDVKDDREKAAIQPLVFDGDEFGQYKFSLAHNGNVEAKTDALTDSTQMKEEIGASYIRLGSLQKALKETLPQFKGAYSLVLSTPTELLAARDPQGFRPLHLGRLKDEKGWVIASEVAAIKSVNGYQIREIEPGEIVTINGPGETDLISEPFAERDDALCGFEFVYFSRPDNKMHGENVSQVRHRMGIALAEHDAERQLSVDAVVAIPESATTVAQGYGWTRHLPVVEGLVKNRYVGRTFIGPTDEERIQAVHEKFSVNDDLVRGRDIVVIDDSIVRGTTTRIIVEMLREAGAKSIHLRISSPPYKWPCYYGMDTKNQAKLLAAQMTINEMKDYLDVDSLDFLTSDEMQIAVGSAAGKICTACTTGIYPMEAPVRFNGKSAALLSQLVSAP